MDATQFIFLCIRQHWRAIVLCCFYRRRRRFSELTIAGTTEVLKCRALCASCEVCHHHHCFRRQWVSQKTFDKITLFLL